MTDRINPDIPSLVKSLRTAASVSDIVNNSVARDFMKAINATTAWQSTAGLSLLRNSELLKNLQAPGIALGKLADHSRVFDDLAKSMAAYRERFVTPLDCRSGAHTRGPAVHPSASPRYTAHTGHR